MMTEPASTADVRESGAIADPSVEHATPGRTRLRVSGSYSRRTDFLIAAGYAVPAVTLSPLLFTSPGDAPLPVTWLPGIVDVLGPVVAGVALLFRRRAPLPVLVITAAMMLITFSRPWDFASVAVAVALYSIVVHWSITAAWVAFGGSSAALLLMSAVVSPSATVFWESTQIVGVLAIGVVIGMAARARRTHVSSLLERVEQVKRERDQQVLLAAAAERASIAREMHDIVSHSLTVMVTLAHGSAEQAKIDPERAAGAMRQVAKTGTTALADLRRMLGVLDSSPRESAGAAIAPQPDVAALPALIEQFRDAGLPVTMTSSGVPPEDRGLQLSIYRLVQESLTNALKHATGVRHVTVVIEYGRGAVNIRVEDDGQAPTQRDRPGGRGLIGMKERIALYGGSVHAESKPGGGWRVKAQIPTAGSSTS